MIPPAAEGFKKPEKGGQIPPFFFDAAQRNPHLPTQIFLTRNFGTAAPEP
jgi:hypothetical protein